MTRVLMLAAVCACWWFFSVWDAAHQSPPPFALQYEARP